MGPLNPRPSFRPAPRPKSHKPRALGHTPARPRPPMLDLAPSCHHRPHPQKSDRGPRTKPHPPDRRFTPAVSPAPGPRPASLTTSRSACRLARSGPRGPRSGEAGSELGQTSSRLGLHVSSASGMGSAWGRPRPAAGCTVWIAARNIGQCGRGAASATGEGCCCGCIRVALRRDKGRQAGNTEGYSEQRISGLQSFELWCWRRLL